MAASHQAGRPAGPAAARSRPRLLARLNDGLRGPLTVIAAPAGFGKTTLLAAWRAAPAGAAVPLAWVSLDAGDNDPVRFWRYILAALQGVGIGETALSAIRTMEPRRNRSRQRLSTTWPACTSTPCWSWMTTT